MDCQGSYDYGVNIITAVELTSWKKEKNAFTQDVPWCHSETLLNYIITEPLATVSLFDYLYEEYVKNNLQLKQTSHQVKVILVFNDIDFTKFSGKIFHKSQYNN